MSRPGVWSRFAILALLVLAGGGSIAAGPAAPAFELEPALALEPDPPRGGEVLAVTLAEDLLAPGRVLIARDPGEDRVLAQRTLGRHGARTLRLALPRELDRLVIELHDGRARLLRHPATGTLSVRPARAPEPEPAAEDCDRGAPDPDRGRPALLDWLERCPLDHADLRSRSLAGMDLTDRDLRRADLRGVDLSDARLAGADLSGANLLGARLDGADLAGADLQLAELAHASLFVTDLAGADLRGADLRAAELTDTSLAGADLTGARFATARLRGVDFTGARCPDGSRALASCTDHLELP